MEDFQFGFFSGDFLEILRKIQTKNPTKNRGIHSITKVASLKIFTKNPSKNPY